LKRVQPFCDVPPEKLVAEREAVERQQEYNRNYQEFLSNAVFPAVDALVKLLAANRVTHSVSNLGNQRVGRIHLERIWRELVIAHAHEECVPCDHEDVIDGIVRG